MNEELNPAEITVGIVGVGLMGTSIVSCMLASGHPVVGFEKDPRQKAAAPKEVEKQLRELSDQGFLKKNIPELMSRFHLADNVDGLKDSQIVLECIFEDLDSKRAMLSRIEESISASTIIGSNTSAIPLTMLQRGMTHPQRILGIHFSEPAHVTRFIEIIIGEETDTEYAEKVTALSRLWGKEPTVVKRDVRGFITNRVSYAMFREAIHLVESGVASIEDVDRSLRNDVGYWMTLVGPFRYMDLMGVPAYEKVMRDLLPDLCTSPDVPKLIKQVVESGGKGVSNLHGFYDYAPEEAQRWKQLFHQFNFEIHRLASKYPEHLVEEDEDPE